MKKVVFLGSKKIGWDCLEFLLNNKEKLDIEISQIGTNLDREDSYKDRFVRYCEDSDCRLILHQDEIDDCDYIVSVQYHSILNAKTLAKASTLAINLHMAPLPEYRGCNQFSFAIVDKAKEFGTSIHIMDPEIDHGDILAEKRFPMAPDIWIDDLYKQTESASYELFSTSIPEILKGNYNAISQSSLEAERGSSIHYRDEIHKLKELQLDWPQEKIMRYIRATYMPQYSKPYFIIEGIKMEVNKG